MILLKNVEFLIRLFSGKIELERMFKIRGNSFSQSIFMKNK